MVKLKTQVEGLTVKVDNDALNKSFNKSMQRGSTISSKVVDDEDFNDEESHIDKNINTKRRLSRMSSKLSSMSKNKNKAGFKGKMEEITKKIKEMSLNIERTMEDVKRIKSQEKERDDIIKVFTDSVKSLQSQHEKWIQANENIEIRQDQIDSIISETISTVNSKAKEVSNTQKSISKEINDFKEEYKEGFRRILKWEINIREIKNNINLIQKKLKESDKDPKSETNFSKFMCKIDAQFDILYKRIKVMAEEQSEFNIGIKNQQDMMMKPTQVQINTMRQENKMIHKELERTQIANREMLSEISSLRGVTTAMSPSPRLSMKLNERFANFNSSMNDRKTSVSVYIVKLFD